MAFLPVVSSMVSRLQYDRNTRVLTAVFRDRFYAYADVPADVVLDVLFADSIGSTFDKLIKKGGFAFQEISSP